MSNTYDLLKRKEEIIHELTYIRGGIGNQILVGWSRSTQQDKTYHPNLRKKYNHSFSLNIVPITINRRGRIIRYKSS